MKIFLYIGTVRWKKLIILLSPNGKTKNTTFLPAHCTYFCYFYHSCSCPDSKIFFFSRFLVIVNNSYFFLLTTIVSVEGNYGILRSKSSCSRLLLFVSWIEVGDDSSGCSPPLNSSWPVLSPLLEPHSPSTNLQAKWFYYFWC